MKCAAILFLGLSLFFGQAGTLVLQAESLFPYPTKQTVLPNGLRVILVPMPGGGLVSYWSVVRTGSRDEVEPGRSGYAHFFEHMMFRGTKKYPGPVYDRIVTGLGADANAFTTDDFTAYYLTFAKEDLEKVVEIESDRFQHLDYGREAFQTEAGAIYGEFRKDQTQPEFMLEEKLRDTAFDRHTYKHTTMGFEADVKNMPQGYDYSRSFFRRFYRPENTVLLIVGDVEPAAALALVEKYYGPWQRGYVPAKITPELPPSRERKAEVRYPGKTLPILDLAYRGAAFNPADRDYVSARLLAKLAFGHTSDLYKKLVLQEQKAEELGAEVPIHRDPSLFEIAANVKKEEDIDAVRAEIDRTIEVFQTQPVAAEQLARVKRHEKYSFLMGLDSPAKVAGALVPFVAVTGGIEAVDQLYAAADRVTPENVRDAARKYFERKRRTVVVLKGSE
jgi:zinc protease